MSVDPTDGLIVSRLVGERDDRIVGDLDSSDEGRKVGLFVVIVEFVGTAVLLSDTSTVGENVEGAFIGLRDGPLEEST